MPKVGKVLERLSTKWTNKIYSNFAGWQGKLDDFDFKLNVSPEPFEDGSTIISQRCVVAPILRGATRLF